MGEVFGASQAVRLLAWLGLLVGTGPRAGQQALSDDMAGAGRQSSCCGPRGLMRRDLVS